MKEPRIQKIISQLEKAIEELKQMQEVKDSDACNFYMSGNNTNMNCNNCGHPRFMHNIIN